MDQKSLSERDICTKFIPPAIKDVASWDLMQFSEEFALGKIFVKGKRVARGSKDRADYILFHNRDLPIAIIEAKDNTHDLGAGMQQALRYAEMIDVPFAYSSNGDGFIEQERIVKRVEQLPSLCDALEARLRSADAAREQGRLVRAVISTVGG